MKTASREKNFPLLVRLGRDALLRVLADVLMVNLALIVAFFARFVYYVAFEGTGISARDTLTEFARAYLYNFWLVTLTCIVTFSLFGFYSRGRMYQGRYKALAILQAVSLGYLAYGFLTYFFRRALDIPRGVWLIAFLITLIIVTASRIWSAAWKKLAWAEIRQAEDVKEKKSRKILVIGGAGYIGSALLPKLLDRGYQVRILDMLLYGTDAIERLLKSPNVELLREDFRHIDRVVAAVRGMDAVAHLGAIVGDPACALDEQLTIEVNLMATRMIAEVAKGSGIRRLVFASTCSVYGESDYLLDERSELNPVSLYARSKIASERVLLSMADERFAPVILRFGTIYGLSGRMRFDLVVNLLTAKAVVDGKITVQDGDQWRPFLHVDDAALAIFKAIEAPKPVVSRQVFNVGSNEQNRTILQVGQMIKSLVPAAELIDTNTNSDRRNYRVNFDKIRKRLGFEPQWTLERGIAQVIETINSGKVQDYTDAKHSNVKFLKDSPNSKLAREGTDWIYEVLNNPETVNVPEPHGASDSPRAG